MSIASIPRLRVPTVDICTHIDHTIYIYVYDPHFPFRYKLEMTAVDELNETALHKVTKRLVPFLIVPMS